MTDLPTPAGFVAALHEIRRARMPMVLWFYPGTYYCRALPKSQHKPPRAVKVGTYNAGFGMTQTVRADLDQAIIRARVGRGTCGTSAESTGYENTTANAGRRGA